MTPNLLYGMNVGRRKIYYVEWI